MRHPRNTRRRRIGCAWGPAELHQHLANVQEHRTTLGSGTAKDLGLYDEGKLITDERHEVEAEFVRLGGSGMVQPAAEELGR